jgi:putative transcriptional regulator
MNPVFSDKPCSAIDWIMMKTRIKEFRAKLNITQERLAEMVGVRRETIIFLEQGRYNPSLRLAHNVARAMQTTIEELFIFEDNKNAED